MKGRLLFFLLLLTACTPEQKLQQLERKASLIERPSSLPLETMEPADLHRQIELLESLLIQISALPEARLSQKQKIRKNRLYNTTRKQAQLLYRQQTDPAIYHLGGHLQAAISKGEGNKEQRAEHIQNLLDTGPDYYRWAKQKLVDPSRAGLILSQRKQEAGIALLQSSTFREHLQNLGGVQEESLEQCRLVMKDFRAWCRAQTFELEEEVE